MLQLGLGELLEEALAPIDGVLNLPSLEGVHSGVVEGDVSHRALGELLVVAHVAA